MEAILLLAAVLSILVHPTDPVSEEFLSQLLICGHSRAGRGLG